MMFVKQLNLNKSKLAWPNLCQMLQNGKQPGIFCLQELHCTNKTKDWALVQNAAYVIKIKDLKICLS